MRRPLLCQLLLQFLVPALVVAGDGDDNDEHEDQQAPSRRAHDDHQHVLHCLGLRLTLCAVESLVISIFPSVCSSGQSKCGTLTALSSTCHANLHLCIGLPHVIPRHALVGSCVRQAEGSTKIQRPVGVGGDSLRQLTTCSGKQKKKNSKVS